MKIDNRFVFNCDRMLDNCLVVDCRRSTLAPTRVYADHWSAQTALDQIESLAPLLANFRLRHYYRRRSAVVLQQASVVVLQQAWTFYDFLQRQFVSGTQLVF